MSVMTFSQLMRRLDLPESRARKLLKLGVLKPIATAGRQILFDGSHLETYRKAIDAKPERVCPVPAE